MTEIKTPPATERLLAIVRILSREMRPGVQQLDRLGLDHALERDYGLDSPKTAGPT